MDLAFLFEGIIDLLKQFFGFEVTLWGNTATVGQIFLFAALTTTIIVVVRHAITG